MKRRSRDLEEWSAEGLSTSETSALIVTRLVSGWCGFVDNDDYGRPAFFITDDLTRILVLLSLADYLAVPFPFLTQGP